MPRLPPVPISPHTRLRARFCPEIFLMRESGFPGEVLIDQGTADQFLDLLKPEALAEAMAARRQPGAFRLQEGYDHSYYFMASFMEEHVAFHAEALWR